MDVIERSTVRLVVLDSASRVLLLKVCDRSNLEFGTAWELPGGGVEEGESLTQAARRELREETGIEIESGVIEAPRWQRKVSYVYRGKRWLQEESVAIVRCADTSATIEGSHRLGVEREDVLDARWWTVQEIAMSTERFYPRSLPQLLASFLSGAVIEEPLETWD